MEEIKETSTEYVSESSESSLDKTRKQLVAKRNDMIQRSRFALTAVENKAVLYILSKVRPGDKIGDVYEFKCREFYQLIKWEKQSYKDIRDMLQRIKSVNWIIQEGDEDVVLSWFDIVRANPKTEVIKISFSTDMAPYILGLVQQREDGRFFTSYALEKVALMKHQYSPRIYELLKSYSNRQSWSFELGTGSVRDLQVIIATMAKEPVSGDYKIPIIPTGWSNFAIFNRDVLRPAKEEINRYTDIKIEYEASKVDIYGVKHRKYCTVTFYMLEKTRGEKAEAEAAIDAEYIDNEDISEQHQMTLQEWFIEKHKERLLEEQEENETAEQKKRQEEEAEREKKYNDSKYPLLWAEFPEFDENQIDILFKEAIKHLDPALVAFSDRDLWAVDFIRYYYDYVKATDKDTRTTFYKRLLDYVRKDYDLYAEKITWRHNMKKINF